MLFQSPKPKSAAVELTALAAAACALALLQSVFPITLGPAWLLAGAYGLPVVAGLLHGYRGAIAVAAGSLVAWGVGGASPEAAAAYLAAVAEVAAVAALCRRGLPFAPSLNRPRHALAFVCLVLLAATVRGFLTGAAAVAFGQWPVVPATAAFTLEWMTAVLLAPAAVVWLRGPQFDRRCHRRIAEAVVLGVAVAGVAWAWFGGAGHDLNLPVPMVALFMAFGNWIAFRFYVRGMSGFFLVVGGVGTLGAALRGTFDPVVPLAAAPAEQLLWLTGIGVVLVFQLVIAAAAKDYAVRDAEREGFIRASYDHARRLKAANADLSEKQARLDLMESAVVHARDAILVLEGYPQPNLGRRVLYANAAFTRMTGYPAAEVLGRSLHFLRGEETDRITLERMRIALDARQPFNGELLNYGRDGRRLWVSIDLVPVFDADRRCSHFVMIQRDVTEKRRTEEALRASEAKFRGIFETAAAGVSLTDAAGYFTACNPAYAALLSLPVNEVLGRHPRDYTHPEDWAAQQELNAAVLEGRLDRYQFRKRYVRPDGGTTWTELSFAAIRGPGGEYQGGLAVSVDVSTRTTLEEQLRQAQKMEALGQLAGGVAHDFNNLLTAILGNLALVRSAADDPAVPLLRTVESAATRAAELTRKLLGYARRNQLLVAPVTPAAMIGEVVDILRRTIDPRIEIRTAVRCDDPVSVDATLIHQALFNLCLNARDAMPTGGRLTLEADPVTFDADRPPPADALPGMYVRLTVADTGCGMDAEVKRRLFEPFFTTKSVGHGTGLGLPMVHGILRQHGGWVTFESEKGRGTRFELYLPLAPDAAPPLPTRVDPTPGCDVDTPPPVEPGSVTVLVVDDEDMIRTLARMILEQARYRVLEACDGLEAVEAYARLGDEIDLVLMDVTMPRLSGRDAYDQIVAMDPAAKVLLSSGYSTEDLSEIENTLGLLSKPYRPNDLLNAVGRVLRGMPATAAAE